MLCEIVPCLLFFPVDQFDWFLGVKINNIIREVDSLKNKEKTPHPWRTAAWSEGCRIDDLHQADHFFGTFRWKTTETIRNSWGGAVAELMFVVFLLKKEWSVYNRSISYMYYIWIMHISHIIMCLANVYMMINYICCCLRRYFGYWKNHETSDSRKGNFKSSSIMSSYQRNSS